MEREREKERRGGRNQGEDGGREKEREMKQKREIEAENREYAGVTTDRLGGRVGEKREKKLSEREKGEVEERGWREGKGERDETKTEMISIQSKVTVRTCPSLILKATTQQALLSLFLSLSRTHTYALVFSLTRYKNTNFLDISVELTPSRRRRRRVRLCIRENFI